MKNILSWVLNCIQGFVIHSGEGLLVISFPVIACSRNDLPLSCMWCVWQERNSRIFDGVELSWNKRKLLSMKFLIHWMSV
jgi:hypothetical protein